MLIPSLMVYNLPNSGTTNTIYPRQLYGSKPTWNISLSDFLNDCFCKFRITIFLPSFQAFRVKCRAILLTFCGSSLTSHVKRVISRRAKKQVSRIYTGRIIAFMTNELAFRNIAIVKIPRVTTSGYRLTCNGEGTIAFLTRSMFSSRPQPTAFWSTHFINRFPKSLWSRINSVIANTFFATKSAISSFDMILFWIKDSTTLLAYYWHRCTSHIMIIHYYKSNLQ